MNRLGNRRTTKEGSTLLKSQNLGLSPNRSWPHIGAAAGQHRTISENCSSYDKNIVKVADGAKGSDGEDYEDPKTLPIGGFHSMKILPARPIQESQYADIRYFQERMNPHISTDTKNNVSMKQQPWNFQMRLETPTKIISLLMMADPSFQGKGHKVSMSSPSLQRASQPAHSSLLDDKPLPTSLLQKKPCHGKSSKKAFKKYDWYIGEFSRQEVEKALMKENTDGTFLVRDGSKKSMAEPYVLVVFHRNKVYNVKIRFLEGSQQFALGTGLRGDDKFDSVEDIIEYYKLFPIVLIDGKDQTGTHREHCYLKKPLSLSRIYSS
ncbi:cytokine-dependent hematopoietic cell linker [Gracilinanus agilis]|uniref:cytokine-dependent hematopoietic cell linker n=1 Tax=Gracilinanus agilis TaxID=191870 RepID=UPI001CFE96CE|nr:cytokine-dependent hematopoietic cell linker [Gracilinanus agilis]